MKLIWQSVLLILSFGFIFVWQKTPLSEYTIPIFGFLIFLSLIIFFQKRKTKKLTFSANESVIIFALNTIIFLLIFSTGIFSSPLFYLLYFLAFGITFIFEPLTVFVFLIGTVLVFLPDALENETMKNFIMLGSLALISPIAFFFGKEYRQDEKNEKLMQNVSQNIKKDVGEILDEDNLNSKEREKLGEIVKETESLTK